nr:DMT family transporter [uncultured Sphingomonas sp.]
MAPLDRPISYVEAGAAHPRAVAPAMGRTEWIMLGILALVWGSAFVFIKVAVENFNPLTYVWLRLTIAAMALIGIVRLAGHKLTFPSVVWAAVGLLALLNNVVPFLLFGWSQQHIASGLAAILQSTTPIFGVLAAHIATSDEKLTKGKLIGVIVGFVGVATMIGPQIAGDGGNHLLAQVACLLASLLYALAGIFARRFKAMGVNPLQLAAAQFLTGAIMLTPIALTFGQRFATLPTSWTAWGAVLALAIACSAFAYVLFFRLIERAGATNSLLVTLLVPPVAIIIGSMVFGERLGLNQLFGLLLIGAGLSVIDGRLWKRLRA